MSWSVQFIGKPENVADALKAQKMSDPQSNLEYESALPHLVGIVEENFGNENFVKIIASGHGYSVNGEQKNRSLTVTLENIYGVIV